VARQPSELRAGSSLCNALADAGYSSVVGCCMPTRVTAAPRGTFVAFTRSQQVVLSVRELNGRVPDRLRERRVPLIGVLRRQPRDLGSGRRATRVRSPRSGWKVRRPPRLSTT